MTPKIGKWKENSKWEEIEMGKVLEIRIEAKKELVQYYIPWEMGA